MVIDFLVENFWLAMSLWMLLMVSDNLLSMLCVKMYRQGARRHHVLEDGSELNPLFQDDVANLRALSPVFMAVLAGGYLLGWVIWSYGVFAKQSVGSFEFYLGLVVLIHLPIHLRHCRTLLLFHYLRQSHGAEGRIRYSSWLVARLYVVTLLAFVLIYITMFVFTSRLFFLGGAVSCLVMARFQWKEADCPPREQITDEHS